MFLSAKGVSLSRDRPETKNRNQHLETFVCKENKNKSSSPNRCFYRPVLSVLAPARSFSSRVRGINRVKTTNAGVHFWTTETGINSFIPPERNHVCRIPWTFPLALAVSTGWTVQFWQGMDGQRLDQGNRRYCISIKINVWNTNVTAGCTLYCSVLKTSLCVLFVY